MFLFLIKKSFFDSWDNLGLLLLINLGALVILAAGTMIPRLLLAVPALSLLAGLVSLLIFGIYLGLVALITRDIVDYKRPEFSEILVYLKKTWKNSLLFAGAALSFFLLAFLGMRFYFLLDRRFGMVLFAFLFWITLMVSLSLLWFLPLRTRFKGPFREILKKSFLVFFDNTLLSFFMGLWGLFLLIVSLLLAFLIPGPGGIFVFLNGGLKILLKKYDYLEENPQSSRRKIPWDSLLIEEKEKLGKRTLRDMIFPWKM